jgi:diguanylate cyclase (GGDEF)-like protein
MKISIGLKLGILLASFGILATGLTGYYFYNSSREILLNAAQRDLLMATQVLGRNMAVSLDEVSDNARLLAAIPAAVNVFRAPHGQVAEHEKKMLAGAFSAMLSVHPEYFQIRLISADRNGLELVRVDRDGKNLTRVRAGDLQEKSHYPYVFKSLHLKRGEVRLSKITINHEVGAHSGLNKPSLRVVTPVIAGGGRLLGLIVINIDLNGLFGFLKAGLPSSYQVYLSNQSGDFLIHPDPSRTFGFEQGRRILIQDAFQPVSALIHGNRQKVVMNLGATQQQQAGMMAAFVRLPFGGTAENRFVILGLSQPLDSIARETSRLGLDTIKIVLVFSMLALILSAVVARVVTGPLNAIVRAINRFSKERVISTLPLARNDELGLLSRSFHDMQREIMVHLSELNESRKVLDHLARHDTLTGLPNRRMFFDRLEHAIANSRRSGKQLAVLFIDLDRFKDINDSFGHAVGDGVLIRVASLLKSAVREVDTVARLGGDEFVILLDTIDDPQHVTVIIRKLHTLFQRPMRMGGHELQVHASIGAGIFPRDGNDADELMQNADQAMYHSKKDGKSTSNFHLFGSE